MSNRCKLSATSMLATTQPEVRRAMWRDALLRARLEKHNSNREFVALVMEFYRHLTPWVQYQPATISYDGRPHN